MLAELREWITVLVAMIFFATILEMLLPTSQMRRFVRLVIGLVLIIVLMRPIFRVMEFAFAPERVLWHLEQSLAIDRSLTTSGTAQQQYDDLVLKTVKERVRQQVEQSVNEINGVREASADVVLEPGKAGEPPRIVSIDVVVKPGSRGAVAVVKPVDVKLQPDRTAATPLKDPQGWTSQEQRLAIDIQKSLASIFDLETKAIQVLIAQEQK